MTVVKAAKAVLALDAAGRACSAAVWCDGGIVAARHEQMSRGQSEALVPMVEAVMRQAKKSYADLIAVAVTRGPGGFTGIRIGLAAAGGIALAAGVPLVAITCFEAIAAAVKRPATEPDAVLTVVLDAKRSDVYAQSFRWDPDLPLPRAVTEPGALEPDALAARLPKEEPLILAGDGVALAEPALRAASRKWRIAEQGETVDAAVVAEIVGKGAVASDPTVAQGAVRPLYLRPPDVTLPA